MSDQRWTPSTPLTLIGKPGCHLCDLVRPVLAAAAERHGLALEEVDIREHPNLLAAYAEEMAGLERACGKVREVA